MPIRYWIIDSHRNMSSKRRSALIDFFGEVKGTAGEESMKQVSFCDWYESEYAVKWFEVVVTAAENTINGKNIDEKRNADKEKSDVSSGNVVGYLRCFRNPDDVCQWYIGDVHVRKYYRRMGIAAHMYEKVFAELEKYEAAENVIAAVRRDNKYSIGLHTKMGFKDTKELCIFASFFADENETMYRKWLYRYLPVPEDIGIDKLTEMFLPIWVKDQSNSRSQDSNTKEKDEEKLRKLLKKIKSKKIGIETIWCGNRLVGFKYEDVIIGELQI